MLGFFFLGPVEVANKFGMSTGAVHNCTRVFIGAVNKLAETYITWPSAERREDLAEYAWETFGFRGCVGSTDGTTRPLAYAPRIQPWTYWDRHDRYSINLLLACDHERNIISATLGFTGAASDAYVQRHADWCRYPGQHFSLLEYLLGDKGMHHTARVVGPYKGAAGDKRPNKNFNFQLSRLRVVSEHVIGMLKGRWMSLRELRVSIGSEGDFKEAMEWILACCVLHNVCNSLGDREMMADVPAEAANDVLPADGQAEECRSRVRRDVLAFMRATGQYKP